MSKYRRAARVDNNQNEIVDALLKIQGVSIEKNHDDILAGYMGRTYWYELKSESAVSKKTGKVLESAKKPTQKVLEAEWKGHYKIVSSLDQILTDMGILK